MPVGGFLSERACRYGRYASEPADPSAARAVFVLTDRDRELINRRRGERLKLGVAVQLGTVRFLGTFLAEDPLDVPWAVVDFLASQLGIADASCVKRHTERPKTAYEHAWEIAREFGYRRFSDADAQAEPQAFLAARAWTRAEQPTVLFDAATAHLLERKVLLPAAAPWPSWSLGSVRPPPIGCGRSWRV